MAFPLKFPTHILFVFTHSVLFSTEPPSRCRVSKHVLLLQEGDACSVLGNGTEGCNYQLPCRHMMGDNRVVQGKSKHVTPPGLSPSKDVPVGRATCRF
jgi:hypothetical protein